ncbi:MAG: hypothetical protein ACFFKA_11785, partial [Candidatus Thorarchaeota archaeon]
MKQAIGKKMPQRKKEPLPTIAEKIEAEVSIKEKPQEIEIEWEKGIEDEIKIPEITQEIKVQDVPKKEILSVKTLKNWTIKELREYCSERNIMISKSARKTDIIKSIQEYYLKGKEELIETVEVVEKPVEVLEQKQISSELIHKVPKVKPIAKEVSKQEETPLITTEKILESLTHEGEPITSLIFKMKIKDMMDARFLQLKLKELERKGLVLVDTKKGKKHWSLK